MSLAAVVTDGLVLIALADRHETAATLPDDLRRRVAVDYDLADELDEVDVVRFLADVNGGGHSLGAYADARVSVLDDSGRGLVKVDVRSVTLFCELGGPTSWLEVTWQGVVTASSTGSAMGGTETQYVGTSENLVEPAFMVCSPYGATDFAVDLEHVVVT